MNTYTFKCLHCGKEDKIDKNYLFEDLRAGKIEIEEQCIHCNNIQKNKVTVTIEPIETLSYILSHEDIEEFLAAKFPMDWQLCRVEQVSFTDDVSKELGELVLDYLRIDEPKGEYEKIVAYMEKNYE